MTEPPKKSASSKSVRSQGSSHRDPRQQRSISLRDTRHGAEATARAAHMVALRTKKRRRSLQGVGGERRDESEKADVDKNLQPSAEEKPTPSASGEAVRRTEATTSLLRSAQRRPGKTCLLNTSNTSLVAVTLAAVFIALITYSRARSDYHQRILESQETAVTTRGTRCHDEACRRIGELLEDAIDSRAQPCDDFHAYVCGSWSRTHPGQTVSQVITSTFLGNVTRRARDILVLFPNASVHQTAVQKAARHLVACDNIVAASEDQSEDVREVLGKGGISWPSRAPEKPAPCVLKAMFYMSHVVKIPVLIDVSVERGPKQQVVIRKPESVSVLLGDVKRRVNSSELRKYERYFRMVYDEFSGSDDSTIVEERFRNIVRLEYSLKGLLKAPARTTKYGSNDTWLTNTANVHHLSRTISKERWLKAFRVFMTIPEKRSVPVVVHAGIYIQRLFSLHEKLGEADFTELYAWLCIQALVPFSSGRIVAARNVESRGSTLGTHRRYCFSITDRVLHYAIEHPYINDVATAEVEEDVGKLTRQISQSFAQILQRTGSQSLANKCVAHAEDIMADVREDLFRRSKPGYFERVYAHYPDMTMSAVTNWMRTAQFMSSPLASGDFSGSTRNTADANYTRAWSKPLEASYLDVPWYSLRVPSAIKIAGLGSRLFKKLISAGASTNQACHNAVLEHSDHALDCLANAHKAQIQNIEEIKTDAWDAMLSWSVLWTAFRAFPESRVNVTILESFPRLSLSTLFFIMGCLPTCGETKDVAEARCNLPLRHNANFAAEFSCIKGSPMRPTNQCLRFHAGHKKDVI